jgi:nucleotide-binding universal stress UspA family protein
MRVRKTAKTALLAESEAVISGPLGAVQLKEKQVAGARIPNENNVLAIYDKIFVLLDGSTAAEAALPCAELLAGNLGSEVKLIYTSKSTKNPYQNMGLFYIQKIVENTKLRIKRCSKKPYQQEGKVSSASLLGDPAEEIVRYIGKEDGGLVVTAKVNVADKLVGSTNLPLMLIRGKLNHPDVRNGGMLSKVLVPLDGSKESEAVIFYIGELASKLKLEIILLRVLAGSYYPISIGGYDHIMSSKEQRESDKAFAKAYLDRVGYRLKEKGVVVETEVRFGGVVEEIARFADEICASMVAMSTHSRFNTSRWLCGSTANEVLRMGDTSLLLVRKSKLG